MNLDRILEQHFLKFAGHSGSCSLNEYLSLCSALVPKVPCNALVFGLGKDSKAWCEINEGGRTVFLENNNFWLRKVGSEIPKAEVIKVTYTAPRERWRFLVEDSKDSAFSPDLAVDLPDSVSKSSWDFIFVDSPLGTKNGPGRHSSIYTASCLAGPTTTVCVHDCDRFLEKTVCNILLEPRYHRVELEKLRIYFHEKAREEEESFE